MCAAGLTRGQIEFMQSRWIGYLATVDAAAGCPHVVPVCYAYRQGCIYTPVDVKPKRVAPLALRRVRNLLTHPDVCLLVETSDEDWSPLAWLQVRGPAALANDPAERAAAFAALRTRYPQYRAMPLETRPLIRILVQTVVAWSALRDASSSGFSGDVAAGLGSRAIWETPRLSVPLGRPLGFIDSSSRSPRAGPGHIYQQ